MKAVFIILLIFFALKSDAQTSDTINWRQDFKLKWDDYQAVPDSTSPYGAISACGITYDCTYAKNIPTCNVFCFFNKKLSWSKYKDNSPFINHEQGHFDIAELFARKFRRIIKSYKFNYSIVNSQLDSIFTKIGIEKKRFSELYDLETEFSRNTKKQVLWTKKIRFELNKLKAYKN
jgi:hypothetical protein